MRTLKSSLARFAAAGALAAGLTIVTEAAPAQAAGAAGEAVSTVPVPCTNECWTEANERYQRMSLILAFYTGCMDACAY